MKNTFCGGGGAQIGMGAGPRKSLLAVSVVALSLGGAPCPFPLSPPHMTRSPPPINPPSYVLSLSGSSQLHFTSLSLSRPALVMMGQQKAKEAARDDQPSPHTSPTKKRRKTNHAKGEGEEGKGSFARMHASRGDDDACISSTRPRACALSLVHVSIARVRTSPHVVQ